jgi:histone RNA hairpin-binding protein
MKQRQKQIDIGKRTIGYSNYVKEVPRERRGREHPNTPRITKLCSKRSWDGQVKKWRRQLHLWDPEGMSEEAKANEAEAEASAMTAGGNDDGDDVDDQNDDGIDDVDDGDEDIITPPATIAAAIEAAASETVVPTESSSSLVELL